MKEPPAYVVQAIQRIDRDLRIRWSREKKKFVVEKKIDSRYRYLLPKPIRYRRDGYGKVIETRIPENSERYIHYHDGFLPILETEIVDGRLPLILRRQDSQRLGMKNVLRAMEEAEKKKEAVQNRKESETIREISGESYDTLHWRQGERIGMAI